MGTNLRYELADKAKPKVSLTLRISNQLLPLSVLYCHLPCVKLLAVLLVTIKPPKLEPWSISEKRVLKRSSIFLPETKTGSSLIEGNTTLTVENEITGELLIAKFEEVIVPRPVLPLVSEMPPIFNEITLLTSDTLGLGVSVAVHVIPPSDEETEPMTAFDTVKSSAVKPVMDSLNSSDTVAVSPEVNTRSLMEICEPKAKVGRIVSTLKFAEESEPNPELPVERSVKLL